VQASKFKIKSGEEITVRLATVENAAALVEMKLEYLENTTTIPLYQSEYPSDIAQEIELIEKLSEQKNSVFLVAECEGQLIGNIDLHGNQRRKLFHTGVVGMAIREGWRGLGVGTALMNALLDWTSTNSYITLLWLEVYATNTSGRILYEKMGFEECGRINDFFKEEQGFVDKIMMVKHL